MKYSIGQWSSLGARRGLAAGAMVAAIGGAGAALAWGATGHRLIGRLAVEGLPAETPAFLHTQAAALAVGELAREPDRWRDAGRTHDADRDPGHFVSVDDRGRVLGGPALADLPATREDYDTALRAVGADSWKAGYLPYSIVDGWQQLAKDFAYWRVDAAAASSDAVGPAHRAWLRADGEARQALILRDLGVLAHYVGDGSQPMHVSVHANGWGPYPNPRGFTQGRIHAFFEGAFVRDWIDPRAVSAAMPALSDCHCAILARTSAYLAETGRQVVPLYTLYQAGGFATDDPRGRAFAVARLAAGAAELRDLTAGAWRASAWGKVGWPAVSVADVEAGRVDPYDSLFGED